MFTRTLVALLVLTGLHLVKAQECRLELKGVVIDFHDAQPLELAQIYVVQLQKTFSSKSDGSYIITGLCPGNYELKISHFDCESKTLSLNLQESMVRDITLEHHVNELQEVQVLADVHDDHNSSQSATRLDQESINRFSGGTLGDALESVHGVNALKTGSAVVKPIIHGLYGSRVSIVNDGLRQQDQEWGVEHAPNIDQNTAGNIQVIKGASALRYGGDAIGGTIVLEPNRVLAKDTLNGRLIMQGQTNGRGGSLTGTLNRFRKSGWFQQATLTYKRLGDFEAPDYILSNTGNQTAAANLKIGYKKFEYGASLKYSYYQASLGILRASHIGNASDLVSSINSRTPLVINDFTYDIAAPRQDVNHHGLQAQLFKRFASAGKLEVDYSFQFNNRKEFDIRRGERSGQASLDIDLSTHQMASVFRWDAMEKLNLETGLDGMFQINQPNPETGIRRLIPDYEAYRLGAFTSGIYRFNSSWILDAGLRYDLYHIDAQKFYLQSRWEDLEYDRLYPQFEVRQEGNQILTNPNFDYHLLAFTTGIQYIFDEHYDLSMNLSSANRAPNPSELFSDGLHHALATIELGRLDLEREQSYKINTVFHLNKKGFDAEINPHLNLINNFIQLVPTGLETTTRGAFPVYRYRQTNAILYGVDLSARYNFYKQSDSPTNLNTNVLAASIGSQFSYNHGNERDTDRPLIDMPAPQLRTSGTLYGLFNTALQIGLTHEWVFKQDRFPDYDYEVFVPNDQGGQDLRTVEISKSPDAYQLVHLEMGLPIGAKNSQPRAQVFLRINNVFDRSYRNYLNRQRFYVDELGRDIQLQLILNI
ncbi:TonB-dependent receptor [Nonlabens xiamenensis]|uniref:TonB-dependent receptor n=1 Tax=Nonlabens xiamenensis TaxID=2341043 RepID=UPI000F6127E5|nr:TonB-dependent receptor [Nonlabens xiamenensis]